MDWFKTLFLPKKINSMNNNIINQRILYLIDSVFIDNIKTKLNYYNFSKNYSNQIDK